MTENKLRQAVVEQTRSWLDIVELSYEHKALIDFYNKYRRPGDYKMQYTDPWCAAFTSAMGMDIALKCKLACKPYELIPSSAACDPMIAEYKRLGRWVEDDNYLPTPGDVIFYDWQDSGVGDNTGSSDHVGIVVAVDASTITVIEGNKSDSVSYYTIQRGGRYIRGYGIPDYARWAATAQEQQEGQGVIIVDEPAPRPAPTVSGLPMLRQGDKGEVVRAAQFLLNGRGASCGKWGADGEFGPMTHAAVLAYQRRNGLEADGIIGPETWANLLGVKA